MTVAAGDNAGEHRAHRTMRVADAVLQSNRMLLLDRLRALGNQLVVERATEPVVLHLAVVARHA